MAKGAKFDIRQLKELQRRMARLQHGDVDAFCRACARELAARLLAKVIKRTPVGQYKPSTGKKGGTLRRGWTAATEAQAQAGGAASGKAYADSLAIEKTGDTYQIDIINPVRYASFVEYGHRTRNHKDWVRGRFMLTISEQELAAQAPAVLERKLMKFLGECIHDK